MGSDLGPGEEAVVRPWYPHMLAEDTVVWTRWLQQHPDEAVRVWYDLHVGEAVIPPAGSGPEVAAVAEAVSRKRIDVVIRTVSSYFVTELKPLGNYVALGQVLMYLRLFCEEYCVTEAVRPAVICAALDPDCGRDFERYGVKVWEVGYE